MIAETIFSKSRIHNQQVAQLGRVQAHDFAVHLRASVRQGGPTSEQAHFAGEAPGHG